MMRFIFFFFAIFSSQPVFSQPQSLQMSTKIISHSKSFLGLQNDFRLSNKGTIKHHINYNLGNVSTNLVLNYDGYDKMTIDGSYIQYVSEIVTYGLGAIDRHWSPSDRTSLILSHNARPTKSIYLKFKNEFRYKWLPQNANWSFEAFNGFTEGSLNNTKSMLFGARAIISPIEGFDIEFTQTSQWGGKDYNNGLSNLGAITILNSNDSKFSNINKMSGFGISYLKKINSNTLRIYGQAIGEDEAGSLPSCYAYLAGFEWSNEKNNHPITLGIEAVDTRTKYSTYGNCGPNSFYNNHIYDYTNYGDTLAAAIDTESYSFEFFGQSKISPKINVEYSTKLAVINDKSWANHRLSSTRQSGFMNSLGMSWGNDNFNLTGNIYHQDFILDKANITDGYGIGFSSSIVF